MDQPPDPTPQPSGSTRGDHVVSDQSVVFEFLGNPASHPDDGTVTRIDTHGAAVFLVGRDAYKVKRAVAFPFMDFSTLEKRRQACEAEIAINRPAAPDLYLAALPVVRRNGKLHLGGDGDVVDWVVHMRRFDETQTLDRIAETSALPEPLLGDLARAIVAAHAKAPRCAPDFDPVGALAEVLGDNAAAFAAAPDLFPGAAAAALAEKAGAALARYAPLLRARAAAGNVRRCHGDLHLRNIAVIDGHPVLFDAIEFDPKLATGDVLYDLAFLLMDLWERGLRRPANLVLNRYLWASDSLDAYGVLALVSLFLSTRAGIRAKVGAAAAAGARGEDQMQVREAARRYFEAACDFLRPSAPRLIAVGGLSGSGKSTLAAALAPSLGRAPGAVILRSDIERKAMAGVGETARLPSTAYTQTATEAVYARLREKAALALQAGHSVIADAVHARPDERAAIEAVAAHAGAAFTGIWLEAPEAIRTERVSRRRVDASDADAAVVAQQQSNDVGVMTWQVIDVSQGRSPALAAARAVIEDQPI